MLVLSALMVLLLVIRHRKSLSLFARRAEAKYGIQARDILVELGRHGTVNGQEDMSEDLALTMAKEKGLL